MAHVYTASRAEHIGHALEAHIRSRMNDRRWYRRNRDVFAWGDLERENDIILRELFRVRRDAIRLHAQSEEHVALAWRELVAANDAAWAVALTSGPSDLLPDVDFGMAS